MRVVHCYHGHQREPLQINASIAPRVNGHRPADLALSDAMRLQGGILAEAIYAHMASGVVDVMMADLLRLRVGEGWDAERMAAFNAAADLLDPGLSSDEGGAA